jgi:hypothetical protein
MEPPGSQIIKVIDVHESIIIKIAVEGFSGQQPVIGLECEIIEIHKIIVCQIRTPGRLGKNIGGHSQPYDYLKDNKSKYANSLFWHGHISLIMMK